MINRTVTAVLDAPRDEVFEYLFAKATQRWNELLAERFAAAGHPDVRPSSGSVLLPLYEQDGLRMGELALFPTRVVALGAKSAYSFTMFKAPGMPDELFESQYESLRREFDNIRARFAVDHASCAR